MGGFYNEKTECGPGWCRVHGKSALNRVFRHAQVFLAGPGRAVLKTICDIVPEIAADAKERFGFEKCCTDWRDIVNDPEIDVVSICTPNNIHAEIAIAALNAGKHVLCEKPIASTLEDAKAMAEAAKKAAQKGIIAMNAYQYRRVPAIDLAKKFIDEGSIGKILNVRCTYLQSWVGRSCLPALLAVSERHRRRGDAWRHRLTRDRHRPVSGG